MSYEIAQNQLFNGAPAKAIAALPQNRSQWTNEMWVLWAMCEVELDRGDEALQQVVDLVKSGYSPSGEFAYWIAVLTYQIHGELPVVSAWFDRADSLGFKPAIIGRSFVAFARGNREEATKIASVSLMDERTDYQVLQCLTQAQIALGMDNFDGATQSLSRAAQMLSIEPSLLRIQWLHLMYARMHRAMGRCDLAKAILDILGKTTASGDLPRLKRNIAAAVAQTDAENLSGQVRLPSRNFLLQKLDEAALGRKPMLRSLFEYLMSKGDEGASKEELVIRVWSERYNPLVHDDRVYKAIGRLRTIVGDSAKQPRIITQRGSNYILAAGAM